MRRKRTRYRLKKGTLAVMLVLLLVIIGVFAAILITPKEERIVETDTVSFSMRASTVIIRDETSYYSEFDFSDIRFSANEGEAVVAGQEIAVVYKLGYTEDVAQNLYDVQKQIYECQLSLLSGINKPEIDAIETEAEALTQELSSIASGNDPKRVKEIENELSEKIKKRNELLRTMVQPTEELTELYRQEAVRMTQLEEWTSRVVAAQDGRMSSYFDGYEQSMSMDKVESLTVSQVERVLEADEDSLPVTENIMYRVVKPGVFAIAFIMDEDDVPGIYVGEDYTVIFDGYEDTPYSGTCVKSEKTDGSVLCVIQVQGELRDFMTLRTANATVTQSFTGLRVGREAVTVQDGAFYVEISTGATTTQKVKVDVLAMDEEYAIIRESENIGLLSQGKTYMIPKE